MEPDFISAPRMWKPLTKTSTRRLFQSDVHAKRWGLRSRLAYTHTHTRARTCFNQWAPATSLYIDHFWRSSSVTHTVRLFRISAVSLRVKRLENRCKVRLKHTQVCKPISLCVLRRERVCVLGLNSKWCECVGPLLQNLSYLWCGCYWCKTPDRC